MLGGVDVSGPHLYSIHPHGSTDKLPYVTMGKNDFCITYKNRMDVRLKLFPLSCNKVLNLSGFRLNVKEMLAGPGSFVGCASAWHADSRGSILGSGNILLWRLVMKSFLRPF